MRRKELKSDIEWEDLAEKQELIARTAIENPNYTHEEIAEEVESNRSYVSEVHRRFLDESIVPEEVAVDDIDDDIYESIYAGLQRRKDVEKVRKQYELERAQGDPKEVDVAVWLSKGGFSFLLIVECKYHDRPVEQGVVSEMNRHVNNSRANKAVLVSWSGFQSGAVSEAEDSSTELYTLQKAEKDEMDLEDNRIWKVNIDMEVHPPHAIKLEEMDIHPVEEVERDQVTLEFPRQNPTLYDATLSETDQTLLSVLRTEGSKKSPGEHTLDFQNQYLHLDGHFYRVDSITYKVESSGGTPMTIEHEYDALAEHDLILIDELAEPGDDVELFTIQEALEAFVQGAN